jgi:hypothetical protein
MKHIKNLLLVLALMSFTPIHKFYFSLITIKVDTEKKNLNVSCKLFTDDLEQILFINNKVKYDLTKSNNNKEGEQAVNKYITNNLKLSQNFKNITLNWVGFEIENDVIWIYLESDFKEKKINGLKITNSILCDYSAEQTNLIQFNWNSKSFTEKMNCKNREVTIKE